MAIVVEWNEKAFSANYEFHSLTYIQRWMYRSLIQSAMVCATRPFIPDDPVQMWKMAGCENRKQWDDNCQEILELIPVSDHPELGRVRFNDFMRQLWHLIPQVFKNHKTPTKHAGKLYIVQGRDSGRLKIGYTTNIKERVEALQTGCSEKLDLLMTLDGPPSLEKSWHKKHFVYRLHGEWFEPGEDLMQDIEKERLLQFMARRKATEAPCPNE